MDNDRDYVPAKIADFHQWVNNLLSVVNQHRAGTAKPWGYTDAELDVLSIPVAEFNAAYAVANPAGKRKIRNSSQVEVMNEKRNICEAAVRKFVKEWLAFSSKVTDADRLQMLITVPDTERTPIPPPITHPIVKKIDINENEKHIIHFVDEQSITKAKPFGVAFCQIKYFVGIDPPDSEDDADLIAQISETPGVIYFASNQSGKKAFYFLRWVNVKGEGGPWSDMYFAPIR